MAKDNHLYKRGILNRVQICAELGITVPTLMQWEANGMPCMRKGRTILYSIDDIIEWLRSKDERRPRISKRKGATAAARPAE